jgi:hypothetical protein
MNALLRHTSNIHLGLSAVASRYKFLGVVANNLKAGYTFVSNGYTTARDGIIGLINNTRL